jgi:folate-binding protein YgfZ
VGRYDLADQRAFARKEAVFALPDAVGLVTLTGPDARRLLSALTTLPPGLDLATDGAEALVLDGQGHIQFGLLVAPDGDDLTILTDGSPEALADFINSRRFRLRAQALTRPDLKVLVTPGPVDGIGQTAILDNWPGGLVNRPRYALDEPHPGAARAGLALYLYPPDQPQSLPQRLTRLGYRQIDSDALEALRIAAWRPLASREASDGKTLPHELDWLRTTISLNVGCYPGQETVAKIITVGRPPRRIVLAHLDGSDTVLPAPGAPVSAVVQSPTPAKGQPDHAKNRPEDHPEDHPEASPEASGEIVEPTAVVGRVTSVGVHYELGPIALALVKRSTPEDARLVVAAPEAPGGLIAASQSPIVPASGESDARPVRRAAPPKLARRRRR